MIVYIENPIDSTKKLLNISEFGKTLGYKFNIQKSKAVLYTNNKNQKENMEKIPFEIPTRKVMYLGINLTKVVKSPVLRKLHKTEERN